MSPRDYVTYRAEVEVREQPLPLKLPTYYSPRHANIALEQHQPKHHNKEDNSSINCERGSDGVASSLPTGKIYLKSMQYHMRERKERKLKQLEELTALKRETSTLSSTVPAGHAFGRTHSLILPKNSSGLKTAAAITSSAGTLFSSSGPISPTSSSSGSSTRAVFSPSLHLPIAMDQSRTMEDRHEDMILLAHALQKPPSRKTTRRLQEGLERSYPLSRMDAKKRTKKEARFHLLTQKAQEYRMREHYVRDHDYHVSSSPSSVKENHAPPTQKNDDDGCPESPRSPISTASVVSDAHSKPAVSQRRLNSPSQDRNGGNNSSIHSKKEEHNESTSIVKATPRIAYFNFDLNCIMPTVDECAPVQKWPSIHPGPKEISDPVLPTTAKNVTLPSDDVSSDKSTRDELMKIRSELKLRKKSKRRSRSLTSKSNNETPRIKGVRFAEPLVTDIRHRPYTRPEDIEKLYFVEEELDELEWDRANVDGDQFEVALDDFKADQKSVSVTYKNKRSILDRARNSAGELIPFSPSDLSAIYE